ncbi:MAG: Gfo/Idh/MocA family oxidoreductase [Pirellulaceae bacterium]|nr:Gfo/Idh/MocA family oxidoreductase [Planctomycetales bacterium]
MLKPTRRQFLEEAMIAAGLAAMSPLTAMSQQNEPATTGGERSANDQIQHAVIGCRTRGKVHAREFARQAGVVVAYVCDPDVALAETLAGDLEASSGVRPKVVTDLRRIFDDDVVNTVSIAAPNHWHALAAIWAMQSGKHVYVEKPVSHTVEEGRRIIQVAERTRRLCQTGTQRRSLGALRAAAEYIAAGKLGDVHLARSIIYQRRNSIGPKGRYPLPENVDYNLWAGPAPLDPLTRPNLHYDWHWMWATGNGEIGNNNIHYTDVCRWLMGVSGLGDSVFSIGGRLGYDDAGETPNTQLVLHRFGHQHMIQEVRGLPSERFSPFMNDGWIVHGSDGYVAMTTRFDLEGNPVQTFTGDDENHFANFTQAVRAHDRARLNADITQGHDSSSLCHLANISHRLGTQVTAAECEARFDAMELPDSFRQSFDRLRNHFKENAIDDDVKVSFGEPLVVDPEREQLLNSPQANELLRRSYRPPFVLPTEREI